MKNLFIAALIFSAFTLAYSFSSSDAKVDDRDGDRQQRDEEHDRLPQMIKSVPMKESYDLAGEALPLDKMDVRERLDRELSVNSYWHSTTLLHIKAARKHFAAIEPILAEKGVPDDFKYLAVAESSLRNVTSPAGAKGFWQFLKTTGREYGLQVSTDVDERYHLEKSTAAAAEYLLYLKERFGTWTLAAAAYNGGETKIARLLKEQRARTYYELNLTEETMRYVFRIVAIKEIMSEPEKYGFDLGEKVAEDDQEFYELEVNTTVANWGDFAREYGTDYRTLKYYNPWLLTSKLDNASGKVYKIKIPKK